MPPKPSPKLKFKSDEAAAEALERMLEEDMVQKLDLYDTTFHLHAMDKLTLSETQELQDTGIAELERKRYLLKNVVPTKGPYEGMRALRRALKHSKQTEILNVLEKAYENALNPILVEKLRRLQMAELECQTEVGYPVQATASDCHDDITVFDLSLVRRDDGGTESRSAMSNSVSSDDDDDDNCDYDVTLDSPVEQKFQPSSRVNFRPAVEPQPQSRPNNVASLISIVTMESLQPQSDGVVSLKSLATVESQPCPQSGGGSSLNSSVAMELQPQPQSDSLNSLVITEHPEVEDVGSLDSLIEQQPLQSNNISSTFATESQPQPEFDDAASLNSPVQQSKSPPYVKVMLPQEGTVTLQVAPSPETNGDHNGATGNVIVGGYFILMLIYVFKLQQQPQSRSDNFASFDSLATTESQSQPEVNGTASLNSPVQQPSQSKSPYVKVMLPYEGTITVQVAPSPHDPHPYDTNGNHNGAAGVGDHYILMFIYVFKLQHGNDIIMSVDQVQSDAIVIKFVFVGDASTGKTSLLKRYIDNIFSTKNHVVSLIVSLVNSLYQFNIY